MKCDKRQTQEFDLWKTLCVGTDTKLTSSRTSQNGLNDIDSSQKVNNRSNPVSPSYSRTPLRYIHLYPPFPSRSASRFHLAYYPASSLHAATQHPMKFSNRHLDNSALPSLRLKASKVAYYAIEIVCTPYQYSTVQRSKHLIKRICQNPISIRTREE